MKIGKSESGKRALSKMQLSFQDKIIEVSCWVILAFSWILVLGSISKLPDTIPTHFNFKGEVDDFGNKYTLLILPVISTFMVIGLTRLSRFPHLLNYLVKITNENFQIQSSIAIKLLRFLKLIILFLFTWIEFSTIQVASGKSSGLGVWFLPVFLALIFIPLIYFIAKSFRNK